ncbi:MAG: Hpt domain-containing protein [Clostridia bacterium]|nr:Hpt domain-containing protein [Clostridia bacterium]
MEFSQLLIDLNIDTQTLLNRFSGNEMLVKRFLLKFPNDATYEKLRAACQALDYTAIANEAHSLKGIASNLSLDRLGAQSSDLCEWMRAGKTEGIDERLNEISAEYDRIVSLIAAFNT